MSNQPPIEVPQGAIRFNTDSQKLEFYAQDQWHEMDTSVTNLDGGARGTFTGGEPSISNNMDYITIGSAGNAIDFGNLSSTYRESAGCSNGTRGVFNVGSPASDAINTMEYITIASTGDTTDFGDLFYAVANAGGTSNGTRGVFGGGSGAAYTNTIQYITIATTGNAADFGELTFTRITYSATSDSHGGLS